MKEIERKVFQGLFLFNDQVMNAGLLVAIQENVGYK